MLRIPRYVQRLLLLCVGSTIFCAVFIILLSRVDEKIDKKIDKQTSAGETELRKYTPEVLMTPMKTRNFTDEQVRSCVVAAKLDRNTAFLSLNGTTKIKMFDFLGFVIPTLPDFAPLRKRFSPWKNCSVKRCILTYRSKDLDAADAVVFHLHLTKSTSELPTRHRWDQRWIFLSDESPMHTFLYGSQEAWKYNGLFNWSMTYRTDSDVPVPYGRVISRSFENSQDKNFPKSSIKKLKTKLVTVMGSNCAGTNGRWNYINKLKLILGKDLDIYGKCLNGNRTACPGHFDKDCLALNAYKFYLAFENSNCKEYITEKVFWHGYHKMAIPIIMGASKKDCEQLLPPYSFLHVSDFANPAALANYIQYLNRHDDKYLEYHEWRRYYEVINEHGYFGSISRHYCRICEALHYNVPITKVYKNMELFFNKKQDCTL